MCDFFVVGTVESVFEPMLRDYSRVIEENQRLNDALKNCNEVVRENIDVITALEKEIEKLKEENEKRTSNDPESLGKVSDATGEDSTVTADTSEDHRIDAEELQRDLAEKDRMIEQLLKKFEDLKLSTVALTPSSPLIHEPTANESDSRPGSTMDSLDSSRKLKKKIQNLEKISKDIETLFERKENGLLEQQARTNELTKQLESRREPSSST